jgi:hypothetical protein
MKFSREVAISSLAMIQRQEAYACRVFLLANDSGWPSIVLRLEHDFLEMLRPRMFSLHRST